MRCSHLNYRYGMGTTNNFTYYTQYSSPFSGYPVRLLRAPSLIPSLRASWLTICLACLVPCMQMGPVGGNWYRGW